MKFYSTIEILDRKRKRKVRAENEQGSEKNSWKAFFIEIIKALNDSYVKFEKNSNFLEGSLVEMFEFNFQCYRKERNDEPERIFMNFNNIY